MELPGRVHCLHMCLVGCNSSSHSSLSSLAACCCVEPGEADVRLHRTSCQLGDAALSTRST